MLSKIDRKLIRALSENGRMSWVNLGAAVGLSPSACQRRVEALQANGVIRKFTVDIKPEAVGQAIHAIVQIKVERQDVETARSFRDRLSSYPEISGFYKLSGAVDYLIHLHVEDITALSNFLDNRLLALDGVVDASSAIVLAEQKVRYSPVSL